MLKPRTTPNAGTYIDPEVDLNASSVPDEYNTAYSDKYKMERPDMNNDQFKQMLDLTNVGIDFGTNMFNNFRNKKSERNMYENYQADQQVGAGDYSRGTYETNSGLFRPDEMGFNGIAKYGGNMQDESEESVYDLTQEEIDEIIQNGGEVEFI
jgi:hypothetical protein